MRDSAAGLALLAEIRDELRGLRADLTASALRAVTPIAAYGADPPIHVVVTTRQPADYDCALVAAEKLNE